MPGTASAKEQLDTRRAVRLEYFTVAWNSVEALIALAAGAAAGSIALVGFGLDSVIETVSGLAVLWRFRQYGGEEAAAEGRALRIVGGTFWALAIYVGYEGIVDLWHRHAPRFSLVGMALAIASFLVMAALGVAKRNVARRLKSRALAADSVETLMCMWLSAALLMGLALNGGLGWWWADPLAALLMAAFMAREGREAFEDASKVGSGSPSEV